MDIKTDALLEHLLLQGAIEIADIDIKTGETYYNITNKLQEIAPKIYKELEDQFENHLFILSQRGPKSMTWKIRG